MSGVIYRNCFKVLCKAFPDEFFLDKESGVAEANLNGQTFLITFEDMLFEEIEIIEQAFWEKFQTTPFTTRTKHRNGGQVECKLVEFICGNYGEVLSIGLGKSSDEALSSALLGLLAKTV